MEIVPGFFGDWGLVRAWARIGRSAQVRTDWFDREAEAKDARFSLRMQKTKRGYELLVNPCKKRSAGLG